MQTSLFYRSYVSIIRDKFYRYLTLNMTTAEFIIFPYICAWQSMFSILIKNLSVLSSYYCLSFGLPQ